MFSLIMKTMLQMYKAGSGVWVGETSGGLVGIEGEGVS